MLKVSMCVGVRGYEHRVADRHSVRINTINLNDQCVCGGEYFSLLYVCHF